MTKEKINEECFIGEGTYLGNIKKPKKLLKNSSYKGYLYK